MKAKRFGRYIVAAPKICHGKLTFRGTRIMVSAVLELVAEGTNCTKDNNDKNDVNGTVLGVLLVLSVPFWRLRHARRLHPRAWRL